jgi:hypothetical protein
LSNALGLSTRDVVRPCSRHRRHVMFLVGGGVAGGKCVTTQFRFSFETIAHILDLSLFITVLSTN